MDLLCLEVVINQHLIHFSFDFRRTSQGWYPSISSIFSCDKGFKSKIKIWVCLICFQSKRKCCSFSLFLFPLETEPATLARDTSSSSFKSKQSNQLCMSGNLSEHKEPFHFCVVLCKICIYSFMVYHLMSGCGSNSRRLCCLRPPL